MGDLEYDKRHGRGLGQFIDGSIYEGSWVNDKCHGKGFFIDIDGQTYEGEYLNNKCHGGTYLGDFVDD